MQNKKGAIMLKRKGTKHYLIARMYPHKENWDIKVPKEYRDIKQLCNP